MSRRLGTVLRVAALQERIARAGAGGTQAQLEAARAAQQRARDALAAAVLDGPDSIAAAAQSRALRAAVVTAADDDVRQAEQARADALARWSRARQRSRLLDQLDARRRAEQDAEQLQVAQALVDELSAGRNRSEQP